MSKTWTMLCITLEEEKTSKFLLLSIAERNALLIQSALTFHGPLNTYKMIIGFTEAAGSRTKANQFRMLQGCTLDQLIVRICHCSPRRP